MITAAETTVRFRQGPNGFWAWRASPVEGPGWWAGYRTLPEAVTAAFAFLCHPFAVVVIGESK